METGPSKTSKSRGYRDLVVWRKAIELADAVYGLTAAFPQAERFGLADQLRRAAVSVASNIAEGHKRGSRREYRRFLAISHGSLAEIDTQVEIAVRVEYTTREALVEISELLDHIGRMLTNLRLALRR
jgi:four helix bundle protein